MDLKREYAVAFELAATGRYGEARTRLLEILQNLPSHIDALVLLGKVEYYLKRYRDSRKCFETVLTYEPGNFAAYFGLEYYKERARKIGFYLLLFGVFLFFSAAAGFLYFSLRSSFSEKLAVLEQDTVQQSVRLRDMKGEIIGTGRERYEELFKKLETVSEQVNLDIRDFSSFLQSLDKSIQALRTEVSRLGSEQKRALREFKKQIE